MVEKAELEQGDKAVRLETEDNLIVCGRFSYGGYSKTYGLFVIVIDSKERRFIKLNLALSSKAELKEVDKQKFIKKLESLAKEESHDEQEFASDLKRSFSEQEVDELVRWGQFDVATEIKKLLKEKLEDLIQEQISLEVKFELKDEEELQKIYPELFPEHELNKEDEDNAEAEELGENNKLGLEITLSCSPIISPTSGKKATDLNIEDKLVVKVIDEREVGQYLSGLLQEKQGRVVGTIIEINFNEESQRYSIRIKFGPNIYGKLIVEPEVKLTYLAKNEELNKQEADSVAKITVDKNLLFLIAGVAIIIVILVVMLLSSL
ncbi:hypothetical protein MWH25_11635 [Natroniella acetigena]|uniref:hypothetical protein n=1 Tax=Natroniella acetigena TaxID=52004 RepID=UPI00200A170C|nr:hypothetical protein [Natroniella acetigena]MCK8828377.1 hypothetical protein [Natroniella acetigena]